jgi:putative membrane protein
MNFILKIIVVAAVSYALSNVLPGVHVDSFWTAIVFALVLAVLNFFVKPILIILTLPATILTLGLFLFVINALVVWMASSLVSGIRIDGFGWALLFSLILTIVSSVLNSSSRKDDE